MTELQQNRYDQLLRRIGDLKGPGSKVNDVLQELFPVLEVENTTPELLALGGWRTAWQSTERPADVAAVSTSQIRNPVGSGVIAAITSLWVSMNAAGPVQAQITTALIGTPVSGLYRDSRFGVPRSTVLQVSSADGPTIGGGLRMDLETDVQLKVSDDNGVVILTPGTELSISSVNFNRQMTVNYFWRERVAETSELSF